MTTTTHEDQFTPAPVEVTQADREAMAAVYADKAAGYAAEIRGGLHDGLPLLQAFARHRTASAPAGEAHPPAPADLVEALRWSLAEIEGRTRYTPNNIYEAEEQRQNALDRARAALAKHGGA